MRLQSQISLSKLESRRVHSLPPVRLYLIIIISLSSTLCMLHMHLRVTTLRRRCNRNSSSSWVRRIWAYRSFNYYLLYKSPMCQLLNIIPARVRSDFICVLFAFHFSFANGALRKCPSEVYVNFRRTFPWLSCWWGVTFLHSWLPVWWGWKW